MRDFKISFIEIEKIGSEHDIAFQNLPKLALQSFDEKLLTQQQIEILLFGWYEEDRNNTQYMKVSYGWNGDIHSIHSIPNLYGFTRSWTINICRNSGWCRIPFDRATC